jgi:hypothetical protein
MLPLRLTEPLAAYISNIIVTLIILKRPKISYFKLCQHPIDNYLAPFFPILFIPGLNIEYVDQLQLNSNPLSLNESILSP